MTEPDAPDEALVKKIVASLPPAWSRRQKQMLYGLFVVAVLCLIGALIAVLVAQSAKNEAGRNDAAARKANANAAAQALAVQALASQVQGLGHTPVVAPSALPSVSTPVTEGMPSDAQVQAAVALYVEAHPVTSPQIDYSVLRAYLYTYLAEHPAPSGKPGPSGGAGPSGAPGLGPTDFQVSAGIAAYCASHNQCAGPAGSTGATGVAGPTGAQGPAGPAGAAGPSGAAGQPPVSWTYTLGAITYQCVRSTPFDPSNPTYTCSPQTPTSGASPS